MKRFMDKDFFLETPASVALYENFASRLPLIDFNSRISVSDIAKNNAFSNIAELWFGDVLKLCAMRLCGVEEKYVSGNASDFERFREYCRIMPTLLGNPIYYLSHIELLQYFDCDLTINEENCEKIWKITSEKMDREPFFARNLLKKANVKLVCIKSDPACGLEDYRVIRDSDCSVKVLPSFSPSRIFDIDKKGISAYVKEIEKASGVRIEDYDSICASYISLMNDFDDLGCRTAVHGENEQIIFEKPNKYQADEIFKRALRNDGVGISAREAALWKSQMMRFLGLEYVKRNWVLQMYFGGGAECDGLKISRFAFDGDDIVYLRSFADNVTDLLLYLNESKALPKTLICPSTPADDVTAAEIVSRISALVGSAPRVIKGAAHSSYENIGRAQKNLELYDNCAAIGIALPSSTDSESLLSFSRLEYEKRIFCNFVGGLLERGLCMSEREASEIVENVSYYNAIKFFEFKI